MESVGGLLVSAQPHSALAILVSVWLAEPPRKAALDALEVSLFPPAMPRLLAVVGHPRRSH
eukprot:2515121-Pyramimonas_sp.AAC.2